MVVVVEEAKEEIEVVVNNPPLKQAKGKSPSPIRSTIRTETAAASSNGNESDGYETANERDVSDNEEKEEDGSTTPQQKEEDSNGDVFKQQKALEKANQLKLEGNKLFGAGLYEEALLQYEAALQDARDVPSAVELCSMCHANRAVCLLKLGKYEETMKECTKALELNPTYIKALLRRGEAHEKLEHFEEAIADVKKILELDPSNDQARRSIRRLEPLAAEKREKMKEEMIGKLKDMGNSLLGRFGMSIDHFKAVKDPNTGSYSISFQK